MATRSKKAAKRKAVSARKNAPARHSLKPRKPKRAAIRRKIAQKIVRKPVVRRAPKVKKHHEAKLLGNKHVRNLLMELAGEKALKVAGELTEPMSDEELAGAAKIKLSETRAVLNKLHAAGVANYSRTRNSEGWYTYTWALELTRAKRIMDERGVREKAALMARLAESGEFYSCPRCFERTQARMNFEQAVEAEFKCPECLEMLQYVNAKK